jgi:hypothetical protein
MIGAGLSYWGGAANYLVGNAKIYDGAFDYDSIRFSGVSGINTSQQYSINVNAKLIDALALPPIFANGHGMTSNFAQFDFVLSGGLYYPRVVMQLNASNRGIWISDTPVVAGIPQSVIYIRNTGSGFSPTTFSMFLNGVSAGVSYSQLGTPTAFTPNELFRIGGYNSGVQRYFKGQIRHFEIINRIATPIEVGQANTTGSFQGAGIAHSSGQYLLAVDFDKTGTVSPTTFTSTPSYTITSLGGAAYTPYL